MQTHTRRNRVVGQQSKRTCSVLLPVFHSSLSNIFVMTKSERRSVRKICVKKNTKNMCNVHAPRAITNNGNNWNAVTVKPCVGNRFCVYIYLLCVRADKNTISELMIADFVAVVFIFDCRSAIWKQMEMNNVVYNNAIYSRSRSRCRTFSLCFFFLLGDLFHATFLWVHTFTCLLSKDHFSPVKSIILPFVKWKTVAK